MSEEKTPVDVAVELLVYAPVGLALSARDLLPKLVERGRQQVTGQVTVAKMIGQFAVQQGQVEAGKAFERARRQAEQTLEQLGGLNGRTPTTTEPPVSPAPPNAPGARRTSPPTTEAPSVDGPGARTSTAAVAPDREGPGAVTLAIPDYDSLSASQVVPRLSGLSPDELEAVRRYEADHRGRKTILNKVAQLQTA